MQDTVIRIAEAVADAAVWFRGRCNWVGAPTARPGAPALAALGPDLYGGTSGIAMWLAECAARFGDERLRATALGAIRTALRHAGRPARGDPDGLYQGPAGVAYAAARVAALLDAEDIRLRADALSASRYRESPPPEGADVMSGCAGAIIGLLAARPAVGDPWSLDAAIGLGDALIGRRRAAAAGWSWSGPGDRTMHDLCGYAHGAAGIGHAFAELFGATGESRFGDAARAAFAYERSWLDHGSGTWPDLRGVGRAAPRDAPIPASGSWCNGSAGIALSRLRAAELLPVEELRADLATALAACERDAGEAFDRAHHDLSLCHGACGTAEALLAAAAGNEERRAGLAAAVSRWGAELDASAGRAGRAPAVPPGLLLGPAGMGLLCLRLLDPRVPSALLVRSGQVDSGVAPFIGSEQSGKGGAT